MPKSKNAGPKKDGPVAQANDGRTGIKAKGDRKDIKDGEPNRGPVQGQVRARRKAQKGPGPGGDPGRGQGHAPGNDSNRGNAVEAGRKHEEDGGQGGASLDASGEQLYFAVAHLPDRFSGVAWSPDGKYIASGSADKTVRVWDSGTGKQVMKLEGHEHYVMSVAWSGDGKRIASGSDDKTVRVWDSETGACLQVHDSTHRSHYFVDLAFRPAAAGPQIFGKTKLGDNDIIVEVLRPDGSKLGSPGDETVRVVSAKIVLVGESGAGKSGLALRLAEGRFEPQKSTHGMRLWPIAPERFDPAIQATEGETREVTLWDLGGQEEYRIVHQLFLHDTTIALTLLDPTRDTAFQDADEWNLRLEKQAGGRKTARLLVGAKSDEINHALIDQS
ncbi:MAG: ADP-ribosylation factor-like protein, partial [Blastocatellia bacterium]